MSRTTTVRGPSTARWSACRSRLERSEMSADGCGAPAQTATPADVDTQGQVVVAGKVTGATGPVGGAYVRLLNGDGDFAGEVQASAEGDFRFYAAPGAWTV